jgi:eukaryotic-like serine/threonine-protein kinase
VTGRPEDSQQPGSTQPAAPHYPRVPGLEVLAELVHRRHGAVYRVRRDEFEYTLTVHHVGDERAMNRRATLLVGANHPRLPEVHEVGAIEGGHYLVTDFVPGRSLADLIADDPLPGWHATSLVLDLVEPLAAMHRCGLLHREVNPGNVVVMDDGSARLIDTGAGPAPDSHADLDNRADLYALGLLLFECLTGTLPFIAGNADPRSLVPDIGENLALVVATLLAEDPDEGYQSGEALAGDLRRLLDDPESQFEPARAGDTGIGRIRFGRPALSGRDRELARFTDLWAQVGQGQGRGCALRGVGGMGTTRLALEVLEIARRAGAPVLAISFGGPDPEPFAALRRGIENLLREADGLPAERRAERQAQIRAAAGTAAPLLAGLSPMLGALLGATPLADGDRQDQFAAAVARFITELARLSGRMVMISDDAELVDPASLRVMSHLATLLPEVPLLSIGTVRLDRQVLPREHPLLPAVYAAIDLDLVLEPLDRAGTIDLIRRRLPGIDPDSRLGTLLLARGDGNPLVVLEWLRSVTDAGLLRPEWGSWRADEAALDRLELPGDPPGLILARVFELPEPGRRLLAAAAVSGSRFRLDVVAQVCELDDETTRATIADAIGRQLVELAGDGDHAFVEERIRQAVLEGLDQEARSQLHQEIAEVLDHRYRGRARTRSTDDLIYAIAHHYSLGIPTQAVGQAFGICRAAGQMALAAHAPGLAAAFLEHASTLRPADAQLLHTLGTALFRDGRYPQARLQLEQALALETDPLPRARTLATLTEVYRATGNTTLARATVERGLAELGSPLPRLRLWRALTSIAAGLAALFVAATGLGLRLPGDPRRPRQELLATLNLAGGFVGAMRLQPSTLLMHRLRGALAATRLGTGTHYSLGLATTALTAALFGFEQLSRRYLGQAERSAAEVADPQLTAQIAWCAGAADYLIRRDDGERWIRCLNEHGDWLDTGQYSDTIAAICWDAATQGRAADVQRWYENGRKRASFGGTNQVTSLITVKALNLTASGRPAEALTELVRLRNLLEQHGGRGVQLNLVLAELYALSEQDDDLGEAFDLVAARFFSFRLRSYGMIRQHRPFLVLHARGRLTQCRAGGSLVLARTAVRQLRAVANTPLLRAAYQQCRAELYLLEGRPNRALRLLARLQPQREDAPLLAFEIARTTARALLAAGFRRDGQRQLRTAFALAEHHDWAPRLSSLELEFGPPPATTAPAPDGETGSSPVQPAETESGASEQRERAARAAHRQRELAEMLRVRPALLPSPAQLAWPSAEELRRREEVLRELVRTAEQALPAERTWLIRPAGRLPEGAGLPTKVMFGAELPAPGSCCELIYDQALRALASEGHALLGGPDNVAPPQLRRLLAHASSWLLLPVRAGGRPLGVLVLSSGAANAFTESEIQIATALIDEQLSRY